jgi:hypothetical protein
MRPSSIVSPSAFIRSIRSSGTAIAAGHKRAADCAMIKGRLPFATASAAVKPSAIAA